MNLFTSLFQVISTRKVQTEDGTLYLDMKCGNLMQQRITRIQTEQANEIARLIRQYITIDQRIRGTQPPHAGGAANGEVSLLALVLPEGELLQGYDLTTKYLTVNYDLTSNGSNYGLRFMLKRT